MTDFQDAADASMFEELTTPRPISEYHEDMGSVLWWKFPINESPYCGTPNDLGHEVIIQPSIALHIQTSETDEDKDDPSFDLAGEPKRFHVGGWPGYHTHWTPVPQVKEPK